VLVTRLGERRLIVERVGDALLLEEKRDAVSLTAREREVATLIGQGKSNHEIADLLVVGNRTVEAHVSGILSKLGFTSRAQIAVWVHEKGLVQTRE